MKLFVLSLVTFLFAAVPAMANCTKAPTFKKPGFCEPVRISHPFFDFNSRYAALNNQPKYGFPAGFYSPFNKVFSASTGALNYGVIDQNDIPAQLWTPVGGGKYFNAAQQRTLNLTQTATGFTARYLDSGTVETYAAYGAEYLLMSITDKHGAVTSFTRHPAGYLLKVTFPNQTVLTHSYDAYGHITWIERTDKSRVNFTYSGTITGHYPLYAVDAVNPKEDGTFETTRIADFTYHADKSINAINMSQQQYRLSNGAMIYFADLNSSSSYTMNLDVNVNPAVRTEVNSYGTTITRFTYDVNGQVTSRSSTPPNGSAVIEDFTWLNGEVVSLYNRKLNRTATATFTSVAAFPGLALQTKANTLEGTSTTTGYNAYGAITSVETISGQQKKGSYRTLNSVMQPILIYNKTWMNGAIVYDENTTNTYDINGSLTRSITKLVSSVADSTFVWNGNILTDSVNNLSGGKVKISDYGNNILSTTGGGASVQSIYADGVLTSTSRTPSGLTETLTYTP